MYIPKSYRLHDAEDALALIRQYPFALVQCLHEGRIESVHLPVHLLQEQPIKLGIHLPRHNPISELLLAAREVYVVFQGPHALISGAWQFTGAVPTWNYLSLHARCKASAMSKEELLAFLKLQTDTLLSIPELAFEFGAMTPQSLQRRMDVLVGIILEVGSYEAIAKLSQDEDAAVRQNIIEHLKASGAEEMCTWMDRVGER